MEGAKNNKNTIPELHQNFGAMVADFLETNASEEK